MSAIYISILLGLTAAAANVFGGAIIVQRSWERRYLRYFVALGAGFMLATALVEMVPESLELRGRSAAYLILLGYLIIHFFEHTVTPHFHFGEETHRDEFMHSHKGYSVLLGLIIHTFFDGIAIASGFLVSNALGWIIFFAIFLHKIPEGFTVSSVMLASGRSRGTAWGASVILGGATLAGRPDHGDLPPARGRGIASGRRGYDLCGGVGSGSGGKQRAGGQNGSAGFRWGRGCVFVGRDVSRTLSQFSVLSSQFSVLSSQKKQDPTTTIRQPQAADLMEAIKPLSTCPVRLFCRAKAGFAADSDSSGSAR